MNKAGVKYRIVEASISKMIDVVSNDMTMIPEIKKDFPDNINHEKISDSMKMVGNSVMQPLVTALASGDHFSIDELVLILKDVDKITGDISGLSLARTFSKEVVKSLETKRELILNSKTEMEVQ